MSEAAAKAISVYLLATVAAGLVLSFGLPSVAFALLRLMTRLSRIDTAAVAAHHGSISIVTFVAAAMAAPAILAASAGHIAVPAAMRVALPQANPSICLMLSLGVTFPFNLSLGIPLYFAVATAVTGA